MFASTFSAFFHCSWATFSIISTGLLFNEFENMGAGIIIVFVIGLLLSYVGVILLMFNQRKNANSVVYTTIYASHEDLKTLDGRYILDTDDPHSTI